MRSSWWLPPSASGRRFLFDCIPDCLGLLGPAGEEQVILTPLGKAPIVAGEAEVALRPTGFLGTARRSKSQSALNAGL